MICLQNYRHIGASRVAFKGLRKVLGKVGQEELPNEFFVSGILPNLFQTGLKLSVGICSLNLI